MKKFVNLFLRREPNQKTLCFSKK